MKMKIHLKSVLQKKPQRLVIFQWEHQPKVVYTKKTKQYKASLHINRANIKTGLDIFAKDLQA